MLLWWDKGPGTTACSREGDFWLALERLIGSTPSLGREREAKSCSKRPICFLKAKVIGEKSGEDRFQNLIYVNRAATALRSQDEVTECDQTDSDRGD
jgi:hypothetical protein